MPRNPWSRGVPRKFLLLLLVVAGGAYLWYQWRRNDVPFPDASALDMGTYTSQPASLRGKVFTVRGKIDQTLSSGSGADRIILVMTSAERGSEAKPEPLPLRIPAQFAARMQAGREFVFKVTVGEASVLIVEDIAEI
ncbi:MAG TPA: hypothetical protein VG796_10375 [Verrucomicrobiales bacterium]|jgi:hypothetical protein|nr:hypothetical protein [Verrucomicrobiales bacterium]